MFKLIWQSGKDRKLSISLPVIETATAIALLLKYFLS